MTNVSLLIRFWIYGIVNLICARLEEDTMRRGRSEKMKTHRRLIAGRWCFLFFRTEESASTSSDWNGFQGCLEAVPSTWFCVLTSQESPMNLQLGPSQSIVELPRLSRPIEQSSSCPSSPFPSFPTLPLLAIRILGETSGIMESLAEERIVTMNVRPCIFIFRCRAVEKMQRNLCPATDFLLRGKIFIISRMSSNMCELFIANISREWNRRWCWKILLWILIVSTRNDKYQWERCLLRYIKFLSFTSLFTIFFEHL